MTYVSIKEKAAAIRAELKTHGISSKQVSVRGKLVGYSDAIYAEIKDLDVNIELVKTIANKWDAVDRDERTGEILCGGNTYINVSMDYQAIRNASVEMLPTARKWIADNEAETGESGRNTFTEGDYRVTYWNHHPAQPFYPVAELEKKRLVNYKGEQWETFEKVAACRISGADCLAESLAVWKRQYKLNIA